MLHLIERKVGEDNDKMMIMIMIIIMTIVTMKTMIMMMLVMKTTMSKQNEITTRWA